MREKLWVFFGNLCFFCFQQIEAEKEGSNAKRSKTEDEVAKKENAGDSKNNDDTNNNNNSKEKQNNNNKNSNDNKETSKPEPPKDYIHVRARRGQATDSHSLAERVSKIFSFFQKSLCWDYFASKI